MMGGLFLEGMELFGQFNIPGWPVGYYDRVAPFLVCCTRLERLFLLPLCSFFPRSSSGSFTLCSKFEPNPIRFEATAQRH